MDLVLKSPTQPPTSPPPPEWLIKRPNPNRVNELKKFNGKKFNVLRYGANQDLKNSTNYLKPGAEDLIEIKESFRDLGIQMSDDAKYISQVYSKVRQRCGWILRIYNCK